MEFQQQQQQQQPAQYQQQQAQPMQYQQAPQPTQYQQQAQTQQPAQFQQPNAAPTAQPYVPFVAAPASQPRAFIPLAQPVPQQPQQPAPPAPQAPQAQQVQQQQAAQQPQATQVPEPAATGGQATQPTAAADVAALQQRIEGLEAQLRTSVANGSLYGTAPQQPQSAGEYSPFGQMQAQPQPYVRLADLDFSPIEVKE